MLMLMLLATKRGWRDNIPVNEENDIFKLCPSLNPTACATLYLTTAKTQCVYLVIKD